MSNLVLRYVCSRRGVMCCEWVPLPSKPRIGDYIFDPSRMRVQIWAGGVWL
jgi:hypothetical protein